MSNNNNSKNKNIIEKSKKFIIKVIDMNNNNQIDIEDLIILGFRKKGIKIDRSNFLKKELSKQYSEEKVTEAIESTPLKAGISTEQIDKIADEVIKFERSCVSGISVALNIPGGIAACATIPADIIQFYGYMLRTAQKLMYLYGFPEIDTTDANVQLDSETINLLTVCLGVMYGVKGAGIALQTMANALSKGVEKKLLNAALTKGSIYPIVKKVAKWFNVKMTKQVFAGFFKKTIPVVGGVIGGGITYLSFKPCCERLKEELKNTKLSNNNYIPPENVLELNEEIITEKDI